MDMITDDEYVYRDNKNSGGINYSDNEERENKELLGKKRSLVRNKNN